MEPNTNRPGSDYQHFEMSKADPKECEQRCQDDPNCKAWTYVKPTGPGGKAHCWHKNAVPDAVHDPGCISGIAVRIVGIDIACDNGRVYAWYSNGMVSIGETDNLAHIKQPHRYTLASQKKTTDIQAISISTAEVITYYKDGTYTRGDGQNLTSKENPAPVRDGKVLYSTYKLPPGKRPSDIVGISHACADSNAYVWFKDGTGIRASSGDISKPDKKFTYHVPPGKKFTDIVGIGIRDAVYTWYKDGTVSKGTAEDLDLKKAPYKYHQPYER
jgi:hypothetical protein